MTQSKSERSNGSILWVRCISIAAAFLVVFLLSSCKPKSKVSDSPEKQTQTSESTTQTASDEKLFDYRHVELDNGLDVITLEDFSSPIVEVQLWYHVGSKNEDPERQGFAHMFEHMMFKGTDRVAAKDHFDLIQRVGGTNNAYTSLDKTVYLQTVPVDQLELVLWLESERMNYLRIDQDSFDTERKVVEEELRMRQNEPYGTIYRKLAENIFSEHPYQWMPIGKLAHLRSSTVSELRNFWDYYYVPNNAVLVIVGAVEHEKAQELAKEYFGWVPRQDDPKRVSVREPLPGEPKTIVIDDENAPAGMCGYVWRSVPHGDKDEVVLDLLSEILGGGNSSRLYRKLVAEDQIAIQAMATTWNLQHDGIFAAGAMLPPGKDGEGVFRELDEQIAKIKESGVTDAEVSKARNQMLKSLVTSNLTISSKARLLGSAAVVKQDLASVNSAFDDVRAVTAADIKRAANEYLTDERKYVVKIKENQKGQLAGKKDEEDTPITAEREEKSPPPGREGVSRPEDFPVKAPVAKLKAYDAELDYTKTTLDNGLEVVVVENHEVPFITVQLGLLNGAWTETKPGTASMALKMLTKGTKEYSEAQLAEELERYAISLYGSAGMDTSGVYVNCVTDQIDRAMRLLRQVVAEPLFDESEFEKLRKQVLSSLAVQSASPDYLADKQFREALYGTHPYARTVTGEVADVEDLNAEDLAQWWKTFANPARATLIFAGDITQEKALELSKKALGDWQQVPQPAISLPAFPMPAANHIYLVDQPGSKQSQIRIGQLGITRKQQPEYFISRIVCNYFGWSFNSRLNESIRVEKGLTYAIFASYIAKNTGGEFKLDTFTKTETTAETINASFEEIRRLISDPPTDKELNDSKSYFAGSFVRQRETPQSVARDLWLIESEGLSSDYLKNLLKTIAITTKQDCTNLVEGTLDPDKMIIVAVGDAEKLKAELEKIAPVTVIKAD